MGKPKCSKALQLPDNLDSLQVGGILERGKRQSKEAYYMAFGDDLVSLILENDLTGGEIKVLVYMAAQMGFDNVCEVSVTDIVQGLNLSRSVGTRAIKTLTQRQVIYPARTFGPATFYMLSPHIFCRVTPAKREAMCKAWDSLFKNSKPALEVVGNPRRPKAKPQRGKISNPVAASDTA